MAVAMTADSGERSAARITGGHHVRWCQLQSSDALSGGASLWLWQQAVLLSCGGFPCKEPW
jgi:hypothetical protein